MPHIRLEYTDNIPFHPDFNALFQEIHQVLHEVAGIKISNCKSRAILLQDYYIGNGGIFEAFVHLDLRILEGRPDTTKNEIGKRLLSLLQNYYNETEETLQIQITVEIHDILRKEYFKYPGESLNY